MAAYVYGIVEAPGQAPAGPGIAGAPLRVIGGDGAAALVSDIPEQELTLGREEMLAHARVLESALESGTVLPMRFGVVMNADDVRERLLGAHREQLLEQLRELAGKVEMNVRVLYQEEPLMRELVAGDAEIAALRRHMQGRPEDATYYERIRLGELVAQALDRKRAADAERLLAVLEPVCLAYEVGAASHERVVLGASFLVDRTRVAEFDAVLEAQAARHKADMRFKCVGPLPPHSFVDLGGTV